MRWLERLEEGLISFLMAAMTLLTFAQVVARYVFNYSFTWALELTGVMAAWLIFIGMSYGVRVGAHIGIDSLVKTLRPQAARIVGMVASTLCIVYAAIVTIGGWQYVRKMHEVGILMEDLPVAQWIPRLVLPIGFVLLGFRFAQALFKLARGEQATFLGDEAAEAMKLYEGEPPRGGGP
ncbi:MAG TPA: TRAP transporter small permease [Caldimonas sp.]|nr:TRAP transporter small permease [Caldimonas sp.]